LGNLDCRGANSASEFTRQRDKIINALLEIDADIVGLIEIENHATDAALNDLISGLNALAGAGTYAKINTGAIGSDAIKVALIYKPAAVTPAGAHAILDDTVDPTFRDNYNRPALAQTFTENNGGAKLTVVVNHFKSKGSDCNAIGDPDTGDGQGNCNLTRVAAATALSNWLETDPTSSGSENYLILGDLNSYAMEDPIVTLETAGYTDLLEALMGANAYSYVFEGQSGYLDIALASTGLLAKVSIITAWHINADEPHALDYNEEFKTPGQVTSFYNDNANRSSDHDPIIVTLRLQYRILIPQLFK
jgi:predicted extracellular nuclease